MQVLHQLPEIKDKDLLVGVDTADDAGVYRLTEDIAIINTVDFFPPIVDDPYLFGQIAAANAMSDVYAMGGIPRLAMNIVGFPKGLDISILQEIIHGSLDKLQEAGALLIGGHSIEDREIKYGLAVTGLVHPDRVVTNAGARPGDVLVLTKPLGVGVITTALKAGRVRPDEIEDVFEMMKTLNVKASQVMQEVGVNACTDITGFGLLGHAMETAEASQVRMVFHSKDIPVFQKALELIKRKGNHPRTIQSNMEYLTDKVKIGEGVSKEMELLLYDPQTSGGLLISVSPQKVEGLLKGLREERIMASVIGEVVERKGDWVILVK